MIRGISARIAAAVVGGSMALHLAACAGGSHADPNMIMPDATAKIWTQMGLGDVRKFDLTQLQWGQLQLGTKLGEVQAVFPRADKSAVERMQKMEDPGAIAAASVGSAASVGTGVSPVPAERSSAVDLLTDFRELPTSRVVGKVFLRPTQHHTRPHSVEHRAGLYHQRHFVFRFRGRVEPGENLFVRPRNFLRLALDDHHIVSGIQVNRHGRIVVEILRLP